MKFLRACSATGITVLLAACGGGSGPSDSEPPALPLQTPVLASHAPIVNLEGTLHVGADVAPPADRLPVLAQHDGTSVSHGTVRDGVGEPELIAYLQADASSYLTSGEEGNEDVQPLPDGLVFRFAAMPPTVRVGEDIPPELLHETVLVVQAINAALPREWQLRFGHEPFPADTSGALDGEILVTFAPQEDWSSETIPLIGEDIGLAEPEYAIVPTGDPEVPWRIEIVAGRIWVDPSQTTGQERLGVIAHELIHLLGRGHVDPERFPGTLMVSGGSEELSDHILHPLDREALLAAYGRFEPGLSSDHIAEELGPWSDTTMHVRGALGTDGGEIVFGAALRNGLSQPWAVGSTPESNLADNMELSGSIGWSGRLLGLTPLAETVAGTADLTVELATLSGKVNFSELEHWPVDAPPGATGSGATWRDGDLSYRIEVRGNSFNQTGGDGGEVTGAFFGPAHEGMGGVLVRDDLSAGFGGKR
ncbi:MAG: hypothetical protein J4F40_18040 [Alphaproteobacteria bacterium]|nr:hypothetical protein [Alphaproteobacteria bacterium]MCY4496688.1 hypothetical protein [Rhodospirillaceae bacterium]